MRFPRKKPSSLPGILLILLIIFIGWAGYSFFSGSTVTAPFVDGTAREAPGFSSQDGTTVLEHKGRARLESEPVVEISEIVQPGETAGKILLPYLSPAEIQAVSETCADVFLLRRLRQGNPYTLTTYNGSFVCFAYEIDSEQKLIVERRDGVFSAKLEKIVYDVTVERVQGTISSHLFQAVSDAGESPMLAIAMAEIFAWEINFIRDLRPQDSFTLLAEKRYREGEFKGYGRILGAIFVNQGVTYEAFCFRDAEGFPHYYTSKGESVKRAFLKAPLSFTRISSTFSPKRLHPILKIWRAHPGVDYAAPTGTPVKAVGSGTVTFKGWGEGAGNYIALRHNNNYETMYLHLSGFARGLEKGKKVQQGEVIGFVGSTGYSTGPHLDFRMKKDGQYINPLNMVSPRTDPISKKDFPEFQKLMDELRPKLLNAAAPTAAAQAG